MTDSLSSNSAQNPHLLIILGPTASGKSKLAAELAKEFDSPLLINADSQQVYKALPIATNRDMDIELSAFLDASEECTVQTWVHEARQLIEKERNESGDFERRIIIVGGTDYYLDYLLNMYEEASQQSTEGSEMKIDTDTQQCLDAYKNASSPFTKEEKFDLLKQIDLEYAKRIHPKDERKVEKALQYFIDSNGTRLFSQRKKHTKLRYPNVILFRVTRDLELLDKRIDERVDQMVNDGLIEELVSFRRDLEPQILQQWGLNDEDHVIDGVPQKGIFQCIGYKEMREYINELVLEEEQRSHPNEDERSKRKPSKKPTLDDLREKCIAQLKTATKQYARKQHTWFRQKWRDVDSPLFHKDAPPRLFEIDITEHDTHPDKWKGTLSDVRQIISHLESGQPHTEPLLTKYRVPPQDKPKQKWEEYYCEGCQKKLVGSTQWEQHCRSRKHKKRNGRQQKRRRLDEDGADA